jgi:hypothetical protein
VQADAGGEQAERRAGRHQRARGLADPAVGDRDHEQQDEADEDGERADPREHAAAEQVLEGGGVTPRGTPLRYAGLPRRER